jgi:hypothetical protein
MQTPQQHKKRFTKEKWAPAHLLFSAPHIKYAKENSANYKIINDYLLRRNLKRSTYIIKTALKRP